VGIFSRIEGMVAVLDVRLHPEADGKPDLLSQESVKGNNPASLP